MTYDYIIIGAGSAGCVLANRLSEDPSCQVLLLEAGKKPRGYSKIPAAYWILHRSSMDWGFQTEPEAYVDNRQIYIPRGKGLGGSSSTNGMAYVRGNPSDYDAWEKAGNAGWGYKQVLEYFKKSENHEKYENHYHRKGGLLNVGFGQYPSLLNKVFIEACAESGIPFNEDYNGENQLGASMLQFTVKNNARLSTYDAFLIPALSRKNLHVRTGAYVERIIIEDGVAKGVELKSEKIFCSKEVILCAGTIQSPQILLLSGVGQKEALARCGIDCKVALKGVGKNLQDHLCLGVFARCNIPTANYYLNPWRGLLEFIRYQFYNAGAFTNSPIEANAFLKTEEGLTAPDAQFHFAPTHLGEDPKASPYDIRTVTHENGYAVIPILLHPESRGEISLRSKNPLDKPIIQGNFLCDERDRTMMRRIVKKAVEIANSVPLQKYAPDGTYKINPNSSDDEVDAFIRAYLETLYHPVGTCKMGNDDMAVVNSSLQVYGVERLRVIDASIMPTITSGNTNAPTIMIAEKGADLIKGR